MASSLKTVCVTGAAGQIGYSLLPMLAAGKMFGPSCLIRLKLLDIAPMAQALKGVAMELQDCAFPLLESVTYGSDPKEMFRDCDLVVFLGGFPRKAGMERGELLARNANIFKEQGTAVNEVCSKTTKFVVVANPANTNCLILKHYAPNLPPKNFTCLTRLDHNRAVSQIAGRLGISGTLVKNITIWGNHSATQYPDVNHALVQGRPVRSVVQNDEWLNGEFITCVQKRGAAIIAARKLSSAMSAANGVVDHVRDWCFGTPAGEWTSMGVVSEGEYGITKGLVYSLPVMCRNFDFQVVSGLAIDAFSQQKMNITQNELQEERAEALQLPKL